MSQVVEGEACASHFLITLTQSNPKGIACYIDPRPELVRLEFVCSQLSPVISPLCNLSSSPPNKDSGAGARNGHEGRPFRANIRLKMLSPILYCAEHVVCNQRSVFAGSCHQSGSLS